MKFNDDKCKVLYIRNKNHHTKFTTNGIELSKLTYEKDLGVTISSDLKLSKHCSDVVKTVNKLVGFITRTLGYKSEKSYPYTI